MILVFRFLMLMTPLAWAPSAFTSHAPAAPRSTLFVTDTNDTVVPKLVRLTPELLQQLQTLVTQIQTNPAHLHALAADSANYAHIPRHLGDLLGAEAGISLEEGHVDAVLDLGTIAAKDPIVAAAFRHAHLEPVQYLPLAVSLFWASATEETVIHFQGIAYNRVMPDPDDSADVIWQNVAFLHAHRAAIDTLGLPVPPVWNFGVWEFLDSSQHPANIRTMPKEIWRSLVGSLTWNQNIILNPRDTLGLLDSTETTGTTSAPPLRVLFLGSEYTYTNMMPRLFSAVAAQTLHRRVVVGMVSPPAFNPRQLWVMTDARRVIAALPWDVVVVQLRPSGENTDQTFPYYARLFTQAITAQHARAVFWTQWRDVNTLPAAQATLDSLLAGAVQGTGATVAPIPQVWNTVLHQNDTVWHHLMNSIDDTRPSSMGAYLNALVIYRTVTGQSPVGLPSTVRSVSIPEPTAALLQNAAVTVHP